MNHICECIRERRSVRTFDGGSLGEDKKAQLLSFANQIQNPLGIPVEFKFLDAKKDGLTCPVVCGTDLYMGGKIRKEPYANLAFGYSFEEFVLYAHSLGLGTVWLGGTMNRSAFEAAMELGQDEMMPCATPIGYCAKKMSIRETLMRKAIGADHRLPFDKLFFDCAFDKPLTEEKAGLLAEPLNMVRLAPSAVNKQPWRVVVAGNRAHFYLKRSKGVGHKGMLDMQMIDMGIALCHFALTAKEKNMCLSFVQEDPKLETPSDVEYVASYVLP